MPATEWLAGSPLEGGAVRVDARGRTEVPDVYTAAEACPAAAITVIDEDSGVPVYP